MDPGELDRHDIGVGLGTGEGDIDCRLTRLGGADEIGQIIVGVGTGDEVGVVLCDECFPHILRHAAEHADDDRSGKLLPQSP